MKKITCLLSLGSLFLVGFYANTAVAVPVDCINSNCMVSDGPASIAVEETTEKDLEDVFLNGREHLGEDEVHVCIGLSAAADCELPSATTATTDEDTNQINILFDDAQYSVRVIWTLSGSLNQAVVDKQITVSNNTLNPLDFTLLDYTGWDLYADSSNDTARFVSPNTLRQTQLNVVADSIAIDAADFYAVHNCDGVTVCEDVFDDENNGGNLNNNPGPESDTPEYSWQNNLTVAGGGSVTLNRRLVVSEVPQVIQVVPTLSEWGLGLFALLMLVVGGVFMQRRKQTVA